MPSELLARKKRCVACGSSSGGMPGPLSLTPRLTLSASTDTMTVTRPPAGV
ncbi:hypothetical protein D3C86_2249230 [compost metagenome]